MKEKFKSKKTVIYLVGIITFFIVSIVIFANITPIINSLAQEAKREVFKEKLDSFGFGGALVMLFIQILQIVIAFIPGEPVEILMGVMYGALGGLLVSMLGCVIGSLLVFALVRKFGQPIFEFFFDKKHIDRFSFLKNNKKLGLFIFILFFIPGTPKDVLTYFAPLTTIDVKVFILITTFARIPSIITSTYAGSTILEGNLLKTILIFASTGIIGITGILIGNKITEKQNKENRS